MPKLDNKRRYSDKELDVQANSAVERKTRKCHHNNPTFPFVFVQVMQRGKQIENVIPIIRPLHLPLQPPLNLAQKKREKQLNFLNWTPFISQIYKPETRCNTKV